MNTVYHYPLVISFSEEDAGFIAEAPDLPGCSAWGATEAEAARVGRDNHLVRSTTTILAG